MSTTNLLQHQVDKFGVVTVMDVLLKDVDTGKPLLLLDTLKVTSITQEGESKDIRGGIGAPELLSYDFARTVSLEIQDALASMTSLTMLWGGKALEAGPMEYTEMLTGTADAEGLITFELKKGQTFTPSTAEGSLVKSFFIDEEGVSHAAEEISAQTAKVAGIAEGKVQGFVLAEKTVGTESAMGFAINSVDIPQLVTMVGRTFFIDQNSGKKIPIEIEVPRMKINIGGGLAMEAEGDAAVFDFSAKALVDKNGDFFILKQLGKED